MLFFFSHDSKFPKPTKIPRLNWILKIELEWSIMWIFRYRSIIKVPSLEIFLVVLGWDYRNLSYEYIYHEWYLLKSDHSKFGSFEGLKFILSLTEASRFPFLEKMFLVFSFGNNLNNISYIIAVFISSFISFQISKGDILMKLAP